MKKIYEYDETVAYNRQETVPIKIVEGEYEGVTYQYGTIKFVEEGENIRCNFTYNLIDNPNNIEENQDFVNQLGEILIEVLNDEIEETDEDFLRAVETSDSEDS